MFHAFQEFFSNEIGAHLRFQVISRHILRRWDQNTVFQGERFFPAAIEKIGHMGIFFRFGNTQLPETGSTDLFCQDMIHADRRKNNRQGKVLAILRESDECCQGRPMP